MSDETRTSTIEARAAPQDIAELRAEMQAGFRAQEVKISALEKQIAAIQRGGVFSAIEAVQLRQIVAKYAEPLPPELAQQLRDSAAENDAGNAPKSGA